MVQVFEVRPHTVMVSTIPLAVQLGRLEASIPELRELLDRLSPLDPRYEEIDLTLKSAEQAREWLREALD